jgi:tetratricopeptide (TPR) repeat protein
LTLCKIDICFNTTLIDESYPFNMKKVLILFMLLLSCSVVAQPGGGGGLQIQGLYSQNLEPINLLTDSSLKIRTFLLFDNKIYQETFIYQTFLNKKGEAYINSRTLGFGLPPATALLDGRIELDQRMYVTYKTDTMIVDFINIEGENGAGYFDHMDSLVIQKGYFKFYRLKKQQNSIYDDYDYESHDKNSAFLTKGLTFYTAVPLLKEGYLERSSNIDVSFLQEKNFPVFYFIKRADYYLRTDKIELALLDLTNAVEKNNGVKNCEILFLLCTAYANMNDFEKAVESITEAMDCKRDSWSSDTDNNYYTRIGLFIRLGNLDKALEDYNTLCKISVNQLRVKIDRAYFKMQYLKNFKGAISDLRAIINKIPTDHLHDRPRGTSEYCDIYFTLGSAEYANGEKRIAFKHWLKAEEFGYGNTSSDYAVVHFDSIIKRNPGSPELFLARGLAHFRRGPYEGGGDATKKSYTNSLKDIDKAEQLGLKDFRINMYRASVLNQLKKYEEALKEIDIAISKNNTDPRCLMTRFYIRRNLGLVSNDQDDEDMKRYKSLSQKWIWERE